VVVAKEEKLARGDPKDSDRFPEENGEKIGTMNNADCCSNWIESQCYEIFKS
jgi:hypothetical protein